MSLYNVPFITKSNSNVYAFNKTYSFMVAAKDANCLSVRRRHSRRCPFITSSNRIPSD